MPQPRVQGRYGTRSAVASGSVHPTPEPSVQVQPASGTQPHGDNKDSGATGGRLESTVTKIDTRLKQLQGTVDTIASELRDQARTISTSDQRLTSFIDNTILRATGTIGAPLPALPRSREESDTVKKRKLGEGHESSRGPPQPPEASSLSDEGPSHRPWVKYPLRKPT